METKEIIIPDDWEVKEVVGNKIIIREKEKELPKTWEECVLEVNNIEMIDGCSDIYEYDMAEQIEKGHEVDSSDYGFVPSGLGKPMLALCQLLVCRNAWWKRLGWKPDWKDKEVKYCIGLIRCEIMTITNEGSNRILSFPTQKIRDQFLYSFRDLIEEAKELL